MIEPDVEKPTHKLFFLNAGIQFATQILFGFAVVLVIETLPAVMDRGLGSPHGPRSMTLCALLLWLAVGIRAPRRIAVRILQVVRNRSVGFRSQSDASTSSLGGVDDATLRRLTVSVLFFLSGVAVASLPMSIFVANFLYAFLHMQFVWPKSVLVIVQLLVSMIVLAPQMLLLGAAAMGIHRREGKRRGFNVAEFRWSLAGGAVALLPGYFATAGSEVALAIASLPLFLGALLTSSISGRHEASKQPGTNGRAGRRNRNQNSYRLWYAP